MVVVGTRRIRVHVEDGVVELPIYVARELPLREEYHPLEGKSGKRGVTTPEQCRE